MCKIGDVIVITKCIGEGGSEINKHSFVVIEDEPGQIVGLDYTMVAQIMSSLDGKSEDYIKRKLHYKENKKIEFKNLTGAKGKKINTKTGYVKADQFHYFDKDKIDYIVLCKVDEQWFAELINLIVELKVENKLKDCIANIEN